VEPAKGSHLVMIKVEDTKPARAKRLSDAIAKAFIDQNLQTALFATSEAVDWLVGQVDHVKQSLETDENQLHAYKQSNDLPSISINETANMLRVEMQELDVALTRTRTRKEELLARTTELSKVSADNPADLPATELLNNGFLQTLRRQYQDAMQEHGVLLGGGKGENHPLVMQANEKLAQSRAALLAEIKNVQAAAQRDLAIVTREEAGEAELFEATRRRAVDLNMKEIEYHRLDRTREQDEKLYDLLLKNLKEADVARMMRVNNVRVVDAADEPRAPVRPRVSLALGSGLLLGLAIGIVLAKIRHGLDVSLKTSEDIENLGVSFLGLLPQQTEAGKLGVYGSRRRRSKQQATIETGQFIERVVHDHPGSSVAEAARAIRTNLMFMSPDRPFRKVLVTSAAPSEGKTTVACSLAIALAQGGQRVCLIDCDLRRPRLHRIFDRMDGCGVTTVVVGDATIDEAIKPTDIENLWTIPSGPQPPNPADMLHSDRFRALIESVSQRFDRVLLDSAPLVAVTDSAILSTLVDGTVFVVRANKTSKHASTQGLRALRDVDSRVIGAVLNAVDLNRRGYYYYGYQYKYRRTEEPARGPKPPDDQPTSPLN
jgi:capsular exopolysaccharide synthesis family protein